MLELYSYALHKSTVTIETLVLRWAFCAGFSETVGDSCACHAFSEALGFACVANCYNNTPKDCIVNLFCLMMGVCAIPFGFSAALVLLDGKVVAL
jgi:hypothetical protein